MTDRDREPEPLASPACSASEASDAYMGFASPTEVAAFLGDLEAAQRAGEPIDGLVRRMLPRLRDDRLHAALAALLADGKKN